MKLGMKHLAPYLPYVLKGKFILDIDLVSGLNNEYDLVEPQNGNAVELKDFAPILRPLSDLNKEISFNGKKIIPFIEMAKIECGDTDDAEISYEIEEDDYTLFLEYLPSWFSLNYYKNSKKLARWDDGEGIEPCSNETLMKLYEYHFDMFGLIEKGLAIDINTLK